MMITDFIKVLNDRLVPGSDNIQTIENSQFDFRNTEIEIKEWSEKSQSCLQKNIFNDLLKETPGVGIIPIQKTKAEIKEFIFTDTVSIGSEYSTTIAQDFTNSNNENLLYYLSNRNIRIDFDSKTSSMENFNFKRELHDVNNNIIDETIFSPIFMETLYPAKKWYYFENFDDKFIALPKGSYSIKWKLSFYFNPNDGGSSSNFSLNLPDLYCYPQSAIDLTI